MKTEFIIYKGEIKFLDNQIKIRDGIFKWHKKLRTVYAVAAILIGGVYMGFKYSATHQSYVIFLGLALIALGIILLITGSKVSTDLDFDIREIEKAVISQDLISYLNLTLYLKNSQKRKVALDYKDEDQFKKHYLNELLETLKNFSISTEVRLA